jgi:hypothetical protein
VPGTPHDELRPIVARLSSIVEELGDDVEVEAEGSSVTFARGRPFALLDAATPKRLDVSLVLPGCAETERLRPGSDGFTHRVSLAHEDEIDAELVTWLREAYEAAR